MGRSRDILLLLLLDGAPRVLNLLMNRRKNSESVWSRKLLKLVGPGIFYCWRGPRG